MKTYKNEIVIHRNETWTLSKLVENKDGSPYIISSDLKNPYFLITITNSRYEQNNRYVLNKWLNLIGTKRFQITQPVRLEDWSTLPAGYEGTNDLYADVAVFYVEDPDTLKREYKYYSKTAEDFVTYNCPIVTPFTQDITSNWLEQDYYYGILLVSGISTEQHIISLCESFGISHSGLTISEMYEEIKKFMPDLEIDVTKPLRDFDTVYTILEPTRLKVISNLKGNMT